MAECLPLDVIEGEASGGPVSPQCGRDLRERCARSDQLEVVGVLVHAEVRVSTADFSLEVTRRFDNGHCKAGVREGVALPEAALARNRHATATREVPCTCRRSPIPRSEGLAEHGCVRVVLI